MSSSFFFSSFRRFLIVSFLHWGTIATFKSWRRKNMGKKKLWLQNAILKVIVVYYLVFEGFHGRNRVLQHLLRRQLLLRWYRRQQRVGVKVLIGLLFRGRARIKIRVRVRVGVTFNVGIYHWSSCRKSKCCTFRNRCEQGLWLHSVFSADSNCGVSKQIIHACIV